MIDFFCQNASLYHGPELLIFMDGTIYEATTEWIATQFSHHLVKFIIDIFILSNENLTVIREYNLFILYVSISIKEHDKLSKSNKEKLS